jgi:predicted enzyme related to lactoylglutathione lyase
MESTAAVVGKVAWMDLTVPNANVVLDFYKQVLGWQSEELAMRDDNGEYADYVVKDAAGNPVAGVCHQRGTNQDLPPVWLNYVTVTDAEASLKQCIELGGKVLKQVRDGDGKLHYAIIQDPAGAPLAIMGGSA